jgi:hypothetical protein
MKTSSNSSPPTRRHPVNRFNRRVLQTAGGEAELRDAQSGRARRCGGAELARLTRLVSAGAVCVCSHSGAGEGHPRDPNTNQRGE